MIVYAVIDYSLPSASGDRPLRLEHAVFLSRENAQLFIDEVFGDEPEVAQLMRIEERELGADEPPPPD